MPSPFPGMDPWLEDPDVWGGFHAGMIYSIHAELNRHLPPGYVARIDQYVWVQEERTGRAVRRIRPDIYTEPGTRTGGTIAATAGVTTPTWKGKLRKATRRRHTRVLISTARSSHVIGAIEILSPSNKTSGDDYEAYQTKRREYLGSVNLIEIDLLRTGGRMDLGTPLPRPSDYVILSCLAAEYPAVDIWAFNVRDCLPVIPVTVNTNDSPTPLDLKRCFDQVYQDGSFGSLVDYSLPPIVPLRDGDADWAADLLKKHARKRK